MNLVCWQVLSPAKLLGLKPEGDLTIEWPGYEDGQYRDHLTDLPNRRAFDDALSRAVKEACRQWATFGLIMMDIDHFKKVNDTYGHPAGDSVLKIFAGRISASVKSGDFAARYGGEEFAVIVTTRKVFEVGERVRLAVAGAPFSLGEKMAINVTCSFGCALFPEDADTGEKLLEAADRALYAAKEAGRNRGKNYQGEMVKCGA
ncbi:GGDEF domain-containing protein [Moorella naiadis]|uniref:GGDEF domain-containing protein n=1 Tax=Moorella naiadis (nom. illeg.) TaxID=3093670 RepID=UPI003D9C923A